jgi:phasin family protein
LETQSTHGIPEETIMANPRQAEKELNQAAQETARKAFEGTSRAAQSAADTGAEAARAGAEFMHRNAATIQDAWTSGSKMASQLTERSMEGFARAFGITGERAEQAAEQSSRNVECIVQSGTILAGGMQNITREMFELASKRVEHNLHRIDALANCRTPQEILAAQSDLVRDNLEEFVQNARRISEMTMQMADEAARRISDVGLAPR